MILETRLEGFPLDVYSDQVEGGVGANRADMQTAMILIRICVAGSWIWLARQF